ncbi:hypothetical protein ACOMICROBIO_LMKGKHOH_03668 [Vibrio sp. B1FIG11]|nr:hypothetical protein ACOMICROBIO_LMKGKHOH_03668 [Vibrio sp. B1FIG11]CAE6958509.1 hypothetical protein ACOMICROBIO_LMKGKHOH_03668 [Vibrio sp. B1FIG11]
MNHKKAPNKKRVGANKAMSYWLRDTNSPLEQRQVYDTNYYVVSL